jgi:ABC-type dipeptide/oligopeptide/nickel transport system permease subunit
MKFILGIISALFGRWIDRVLNSLQTEAAAAYVAGVRKAHQAFIALLGLALSLLLALSGFVLIHVALFAWLPWSLPVKALVLLVLGVVYLGGGLAVVLELSSDRTWMRFTKVDRILASLPPRR